eukprot:g1002.t1
MSVSSASTTCPSELEDAVGICWVKIFAYGEWESGHGLAATWDYDVAKHKWLLIDTEGAIPMTEFPTVARLGVLSYGEVMDKICDLAEDRAQKTWGRKKDWWHAHLIEVVGEEEDYQGSYRMPWDTKTLLHSRDEGRDELEQKRRDTWHRVVEERVAGPGERKDAGELTVIASLRAEYVWETP